MANERPLAFWLHCAQKNYANGTVAPVRGCILFGCAVCVFWCVRRLCEETLGRVIERERLALLLRMFAVLQRTHTRQRHDDDDDDGDGGCIIFRLNNLRVYL